MTTTVRQPFLQVFVDGQEVTKRFSATCSLGFDLAVSEAKVSVPELPSWAKPWSVVAIVMGANQATAQERFRGFLVECDYTFYPRQIDLICRGPLVRCQLVECSTSGGQDLSNGGAGQTDQQIVQTLLNAGGLTVGGPVDLAIGGLGRTLGTVATQYYVWAENQSALDMIQQIDQICLGYVTFDTLGGRVVRQQITIAAATTAALTFTEGVDIESATSQLTVLDTKTRSQVTGYDPGNGSGAFNYTLEQTNPLMPLGYVTEQLSSNLIESSTTGGTGISCQEVATWRLGEINRIVAKMPVTTPRDDLIAPGMTIAIASPYRLGVSQNFWVQRVDCTIDDKGAFSQQLTVIGGVTGFGEAGPPTGGITGTQGGTVGGGPGTGTGGTGTGTGTGGGGPNPPPTNPPPSADFTLDYQAESVVIGGVETTIWEVQANSTSTGTAAAISTYAWTATGGTPSSGSNDSFATSYTSAPDGTKSISLTVTDANGQTATCTKTVQSTSSVTYVRRRLYLAGTSTIDDYSGTAWATQAESNAVTVACGPVWANSPGYNVFYSADDLATVHTAIPFPGGGGGSSVTALWMETDVQRTRVLAGAASGQLALSNDGGATWAVVAGPEVLIIQRCVLSRYHPNQWFALTSAHLWRSDNAGAGWVVVQAAQVGETFVDFNLSFARGMIAISGGTRGLIDLQGNVQTLPGGMGHPIAVTAHIRKDRFFCYDASGNTAYHSSDGGTSLAAGTALPAGASAPQTGGLWRDGQIAGLLYVAAGAGGVWKSIDGFGSSGGYYQLRTPGVGSSPRGAVYAQVGVDGTLTTSKIAATSALSGTAAKALSLWNGSSNNAPPTNWQDPSFSDASWSAAVLNSSYPSGPDGSGQIWAEYPGVADTEQVLTRQTFTLPAGTITTATIRIFCVTFVGVWINGVFLPGSATGSDVTLTVPPSLLLPGAANLIATHAAANSTLHTGFFLRYNLEVS